MLRKDCATPRMLSVLREMGQKREKKVMIRSSLLSLCNTFPIFFIHHFKYIENSFTNHSCVIKVFMLILWPTSDAVNRKTLQISCCCWTLTRTEGYLHQTTRKSMLSVANGILHDWDPPGAQEPHRAAPQLCGALAHRLPWPLGWDCCHILHGPQQTSLQNFP